VCRSLLLRYSSQLNPFPQNRVLCILDFCFHIRVHRAVWIGRRTYIPGNLKHQNRPTRSVDTGRTALRKPRLMFAGIEPLPPTTLRYRYPTTPISRNKFAKTKYHWAGSPGTDPHCYSGAFSVVSHWAIPYYLVSLACR